MKIKLRMVEIIFQGPNIALKGKGICGLANTIGYLDIDFGSTTSNCVLKRYKKWQINYFA